MRKGSNGHLFSQVPHVAIPRSSFNRNFDIKTTFDGGYIVPFFVDDVLPGDTFNVRVNALIRMTTPIVPTMSNIYADFFFFSVPNRLVWNNWEKFNGQQDDPGDSTDYLVPQMAAPASNKVDSKEVGGVVSQSLADYLQVPLHVPGLKFNSLDFRAYNLIYNDWFRDENLQDSLLVPKGDGPDTYTDFVLKKRGKRHDYFTSALPWPQKGPGVDIPLGDTAPVTIFGNGENIHVTTSLSPDKDQTLFGNFDDTNGVFNRVGMGPNGTSSEKGYLRFALRNSGWTVGLAGEADLSSATAASINTLRQAFALQRLFERDARGGTRYTEIIRSHFGVVSPDARLQRPEYLGGGTIRINVNPVVQQSATDSSTPQGNLAAYAYGSASLRDGIGFTKSFTEHGIVMGFVNIRTDLAYQQGLPRRLSRQTRYDYMWPALSHTGEQAILNKEIFAQGTAMDDDVFGYQERYAEYRYYPSVITGKMRSTSKNVTTGASDSLDVWHLAQNFSSLPGLNSTFIEENPPFDRLLAVQYEPEFIMDGYIHMICVRPLPLYGVPGPIDRF